MNSPIIYRRFIISEYTVGQVIMHPGHGIGKIIGREDLDFVGELKPYYVIEFVTKKLTMHVPVRKIDGSEIRETMTDKRLDKVMKTLKAAPKKLPSEYKSRRGKIEPLIKSGIPLKLAKAVRDLSWRKETEGLSTSDERFLSQGREMLVNEMAVVMQCDSDTAEEALDAALSEGAEKKMAKA